MLGCSSPSLLVLLFFALLTQGSRLLDFWKNGPQIKFTSKFDENNVREKVLQLESDTPLAESPFAQIYSAKKDENGVRRAVKVYKDRTALGEMMFQNGVEVIRRLCRVPKERRGHLIRILDLGEILQFGDAEARMRGNRLIVMELGERTLWKKMADKAFAKKRLRENSEEFQQLVVDILRPLREFHQVGVHLDFKPHNLILVAKTLKLIDFDGALLIPEGVGEGDRANFAGQSPIGISSAIYNCPEYYQDGDQPGKELSTKADIWAYGITLLELIFLQRNSVKADPNEEFVPDDTMLKVGDIYRGFFLDVNVVDSYAVKGPPVDFRSKHRISPLLVENASALTHILTVWREFPLIALLITNTLQIEPTQRMSANGILALLRGECRPIELEEVEDGGYPIFNGMTTVELAGALELQMKTAHRSEKLRTMAGLLGEATAKRRELVKRLKEKELCDTKTTTFVLE